MKIVGQRLCILREGLKVSQAKAGALFKMQAVQYQSL